MENKTSLDTYWRVQLVFKKVQTRSSLEQPLEYNQNQIIELRFFMKFLNILGVTEIFCSFRLVLEGKTSKEIPESLQFLDKFLANNFALCRTQHLCVAK